MKIGFVLLYFVVVSVCFFSSYVIKLYIIKLFILQNMCMLQKGKEFYKIMCSGQKKIYVCLLSHVKKI
jgi:hypothetical protein